MAGQLQELICIPLDAAKAAGKVDMILEFEGDIPSTSSP
jgi:hypothetical protein